MNDAAPPSAAAPAGAGEGPAGQQPASAAPVQQPWSEFSEAPDPPDAASPSPAEAPAAADAPEAPATDASLPTEEATPSDAVAAPDPDASQEVGEAALLPAVAAEESAAQAPPPASSPQPEAASPARPPAATGPAAEAGAGASADGAVEAEAEASGPSTSAPADVPAAPVLDKGKAPAPLADDGDGGGESGKGAAGVDLRGSELSHTTEGSSAPTEGGGGMRPSPPASYTKLGFKLEPRPQSPALRRTLIQDEDVLSEGQPFTLEQRFNRVLTMSEEAASSAAAAASASSAPAPAPEPAAVDPAPKAAEPPAGTAGAGEVWAADVTPAIQVLVAEQANRAHNIQQVMDLTGGGREHEANRLRVGRSGLLKELCSWITPLTPANFLLDILTVLIYVTRSKENRERIREVEFLPKLVNMLKQARSVTTRNAVKVKVVQLTINVATGVALNKGVLQQEGGAVALARLLHELKGDTAKELYRFCCLALSVVCTATMPESLKLEVLRAGGVDGLLAGQAAASVDVCKTAMVALDTLAVNCADIKTHVREKKGLERTVALLAHSTVRGGPALAAVACALLAKLCSGNVDNCRAVRAEGGLAVFVAILTTATDTAQKDVRAARLQAATCVMHMSKYDPACRDSVRENEYLAQLLEVMKDHSDYPLLEKMVWTLANLCARNAANQAEVHDLGGVDTLVGVLDTEELSLPRHRRLLRGALAAMIHLCEQPRNVDAFLQSGALVVVLFHALALLGESVTSSEADLAVLALRFLSVNNKRAQRIVRHVGGAELALCVQEAAVYSGSVPTAPAETAYKLELQMGKIKKTPGKPERPPSLSALPAPPEERGAATLEDENGALVLMIQGKGKAAGKAAPPPPAPIADKDALAVVPVAPARAAELALAMVPPRTADSSPMTTPRQSVASTPRTSPPGTPPRLLMGAEPSPLTPAMLPASVEAEARRRHDEGAHDFLMGDYVDQEDLGDGVVREVLVQDEEQVARYQAGIKAKLAKRAAKDYARLTAVELVVFKQQVLRSEVETELRRRRRLEEERQAREAAKREAAERRLREDATAERAAVEANMRAIVQDAVLLAAAEAEAMLAFSHAGGHLVELRAVRRAAEGAGAAVEAAGTEAELDAALRQLRHETDTARLLEQEVEREAERVRREAENTEQWQMGPFMAATQVGQLPREADQLCSQIEAVAAKIAPAVARKRATTQVCRDVVLESVVAAVACSDLLTDLVFEAADKVEAERKRVEDEARERALQAKRLELARAQAVELFCTMLVYDTCDDAVGQIEGEKERVRLETEARIAAAKQAVLDRDNAIATTAARLKLRFDSQAALDKLLVAAVLDLDVAGVKGIAQKANVRQKTRGGYTLLHEAAEAGLEEMAEALLKNGADLEARTFRGSTPLVTAATKGHTPTVLLLLAWGADVAVVNKLGMSPLHAAVRGGHGPATRALLEGGASFLQPDPAGNSALHLAACSNVECVKEILDFSIRIEMVVDSPTKGVREGGEQAEAKIADAESTSEVAESDEKALTVTPEKDKPFDWTAVDKNKYGPKVGNHSMKAIQRSVNAPPCSALRLLTPQRIAPLHMAAAVGNSDAVEYMLERGAPLDPQDERLFTPLHLAAYRGHMRVCALLLGAGASLWIRNFDGLTPRDLALGPRSNASTRKVLNFATGVPEIIQENWGKTEYGYAI